MMQELEKQLELEEGKEECVYKDHLGFWTIGIGRLVDDRKPGAGLRDHEITFLFRNDLEDRIEALTRKLPWFQNLDDSRRGVLINMSFQMGVDGLLGFHTTLRYVREGQYERAADNMLRSKWATQQTPARAYRMAEQMRTGKWVYKED